MTAPTDRPDARLFTPAFIALSLAELAYFTAAGLTIPVTPLFAHGPLGADTLGVGLAVGAFSVTALILRPYAGRMTDRWGRRRPLVLGALTCAIVLAAHAFVDSLAVLIGLRLLLGVAEAFFFVAGFAAVADLAPPGRAGEALSYNSLSLYLGIALGPLLGHWLLDGGGFGFAWAGGAALALVAALLALRLPETARPGVTSQVKESNPILHRAAIAPSLVLFAAIAGMGGFFAFVAIYATEDLGLDGTGGVLLLFGAIVVVTRVLFAKLPDRVPPFRLGAVSLALCAGGLAIAGGVASVPGLLVGAALLAVGVAFTTPAVFAAIFARVPASERGAASGTASLFIDLGFGGGPMLLGIVAGSAGIPAAFLVAAIVAAVGAAGSALLSTDHRGSTVVAAPAD
ncbi:MAG TPA: MFS transporter [Candidatus Limnocylindrales bacterium]|nr:MFS transporter [Candidatus Limnocylindrales bacterium]